MLAVRNLVCLATLLLGASALVLDPMVHLKRDLVIDAHRRYAANLQGRSPAPSQTIERRRALRQKRCQAERLRQSYSSSVEPTVTVEDSVEVPQNFSPEPTTQAPPPVVEQPPPSPSPVNNNSGGNDNGGESGNENSNSGGGETHTGELTYYNAGLGACGQYNTNADMIAAIGWQFFDSFEGGSANPNNAPICNKQVAIEYEGKSITVAIVDRCGGCQPEDLDLTPTAFSMLADQALGRLHGATWRFV